MTAIFFIQWIIIKQLLDSVYFCDIQNNQGLAKGYQPQPDNPYLDIELDLDITKVLSSNFL